MFVGKFKERCDKRSFLDHLSIFTRFKQRQRRRRRREEEGVGGTVFHLLHSRCLVALEAAYHQRDSGVDVVVQRARLHMIP